jgi:hypothetical protein
MEIMKPQYLVYVSASFSDNFRSNMVLWSKTVTAGTWNLAWRELRNICTSLHEDYPVAVDKLLRLGL